MNYNIIYNNKSNEELDIEIVKRPTIPFPARKFKEKTIEGHDGNYYIDTGTYEDMPISIEFNFVEDDLDNIRAKVRSIKNWIENIEDDKLILSDDPGVFFRVCKSELSEVTYQDLYEIQNFTINFTVRAYQYLLNGIKEIQLQNILFNHYDISKPTYRIVGNGTCILNINSNIINCNVNGQLTINTEFDKILEANSSYAIGKTDIKKIQDLYLKKGKNIFSWSSGFTIYIIPHWRTL